jgi:hypothetical protein
MAAIEEDRAIIRTLNLGPAEIALLCARFKDEEMYGPFFISLSAEAVHQDSNGNQWRVDTKELARKLDATRIEERGALTRSIFRFWEQFPNTDPAEAIRNAGLL